MKNKTLIIRMFCTILVIFGAISLVTCTEDMGEDPSPNEAAGIWRGTVTFVDYDGWSSGGYTVLGLIDKDASTNIIFENLPTIQLYGDIYGYQGTLSSESNLVYENSSGHGHLFYQVTESHFSPGGTMTATMDEDITYDSSSLILNLTYDSLYDRPASMTLLSDTWMGTIGVTGISLSIWHPGSISGKDSNGCIYNGSVKISDSDHNMYSFEMTCSCVGGHSYGLGILTDTDAANDTLIIGTIGFSDSYVYRLKRQ